MLDSFILVLIMGGWAVLFIPAAGRMNDDLVERRALNARGRKWAVAISLLCSAVLWIEFWRYAIAFTLGALA